MAWQDRYRPGSFRGVGFVTLAHEAELGRRGEAHQYPFRDDPWFEDLGRQGRAWSIQAFVIGPDYMSGRDALIAALEAPGAGTLVHPFLGTFQAQPVGGCRISESTDEGGMARFDLRFVEPGIAVTALSSADTQGAASDAADATDAAASDRFGEEFVAAGQPPFVDDAAAALIGGLAASIAGAAMLLGGSGPSLRAFQADLASLDGAAAILTQSDQLAAATIGLIGSLAGLGGRPAMQITALRQVIGAASSLPPVVTTTPSRKRQAANQQAYADLVIAAAAGATVRATAGVAFASYDDAVALRDALGDDLDAQALAAADRGNDALAADLDTLRRAMIADVTARGGSLARLFGYTPMRVSPALVIAWRLYRDPSSTVAQADDLVARNHVRHPGFVPAAPLQVLTADTGGARG